MISIPRRFAGLFDDDYFPTLEADRQSMLATADIHENDKNFIVTVDLPGFKKEEISIEVTNDNCVHIQGKRASKHEEKTDKCHLRERSTMEVSRMFRLPKDVNKAEVTASYVDGVLDIQIPKSKKDQPDRIKVALK